MKYNIVSKEKIDVGVEDYSFRLTASAYNFSWYYNGSKLVLPINDNVVVLVEEVERNKLEASIYSRTREIDVSDVVEKTAWILGVNEDLSEFYEIWKNDSLLSRSYKVLRGIRIRGTSLWQSLLIGVCQQNASFKQGWRMLALLYKTLGKHVYIKGFGETIILPSPLDVARASEQQLRSCKLGYRSSIIRRLAQLFNRKELSDTIGAPIDEKELTRIKGIGPYTARLALVLSCRRYDKAPIDRWLKRIIVEVYKVSESDAEEYWHRIWGKYAGLATILATIALDAVVLTKALDRIRKGQTYPLLREELLTPLTLWRHI